MKNTSQRTKIFFWVFFIIFLTGMTAIGVHKNIRTFFQKTFREEMQTETLLSAILNMNVDPLIKYAKEGSLVARLSLIHIYVDGIGTPVNIPEAEKWMMDVSTQMNLPEVRNNINLFQKEFEMLEKVVSSKQNKAKFSGAHEGILGYMYLRGWGTKKNDDQAFKYLKESVALGNSLSNADLGKMYQEGWGTQQNYFEAYHLYRVAADKGIAAANYRLGLMYEKGLGVEKNEQKAKEFFQKAPFMINKNKVSSCQ